MKFILIPLLSVLLLSACAKRATDDTTSKDYNKANGIRELVLKDGTKCVTLYSNSITCNWKTN